MAYDKPIILSEAQIAWIAGIVEGEGAIYYKRRPGLGINCTIKVSMCDADVVERLHQLVPGSTLHRSHTERRRPLYVWNLTRKTLIIELLTLLIPWLGKRRSAKATETIEAIRAFGVYVIEKRSSCRFRGHLKTQENTYHYTDKRGRSYRICKECRRLNAEKYEEKCRALR